MERVIVVRASMGIDSLARIINIVRRGRIQILEISSTLGSDGDIRVSIKMKGEESEIEWVRKKISVLTDITSVEVV